MQKKHLIGYPVTALLALVLGATTATTTTTAAPTTAAPTTAAPTTAAPATSAPTAPATHAASPAAEDTTEAQPAPTAETPTSAATFSGDGTYEVGVDIQPGKYASDAPASGNCYWSRLSSDDPVEGIIANNNSSGTSIVVIQATDTYFQTSGCADWTRR